LSDTHTRTSKIRLTVSQYSVAGSEPHTVLVAETDTLGEAWLRPVGVQACRAARAGVTVFGAGWRQLRRGSTTPATRRKPGRGSVLSGCVPCGRLTPCLARVCEFVCTELPRFIVLAHSFRPKGIA